MAIGICCAWSIMVPDHIFKAHWATENYGWPGWELPKHKILWGNTIYKWLGFSSTPQK